MGSQYPPPRLDCLHVAAVCVYMTAKVLPAGTAASIESGE